ncbi:MAG: ISAzo13 family transposase [Blastocatellales bacterium]|nr:ISAzo13 family transposase [Blastocatellales bacterium]
MTRYPLELEAEMRAFYDSLSEKDRRRYAAIESRKLGYGGHSYIARVLGCERHTVATGIAELRDPCALEQPGIRQPGGGRKPSLEVIPELEATFLKVLTEHTAGSPTDEKIKWTNLTRREIVAGLKQHGITVSVTVVKQLLLATITGAQGAKREATGNVADRDKQFVRIAELKASYLAASNPVIKMDTKKELIGNLYRPGTLLTQSVTTFDHDWPSLADGVAIPHGLYDLKRNHGFVTIGTSRDTSEFACDSLRWWWQTHGRHDYPGATSLLLLCDGGGAIARISICSRWTSKSLPRRPDSKCGGALSPYTSKYNPIEHRLFPHLSRACQGVILKSLELVTELMAKASTSTGLRVSVNLLDKVYQTGRRVAADVKERIRIIRDDLLPKWNYRLLPGESEPGTGI